MGEHRPIQIEGAQSGRVERGAIRASRIIAVGAGKGGVGKSTIAVTLAVGLARMGRTVGLLDADIYGPSIPTMLGLDNEETNVVGGMLQPFAVHGVRAVTMGKLVEPEKALIWRGPMAHGACTQLIEQTCWGELDDLIVDLPPGTGDVPLTIAQSLPITGAIVVCTPQRVAMDDAKRAISMFRTLRVPMLGVVENMSGFMAPDGVVHDIFGTGGGEQLAQQMDVRFLGALSIFPVLRERLDAGDPTACFTQEDTLCSALNSLVAAVDAAASDAAKQQAAEAPTITMRD